MDDFYVACLEKVQNATDPVIAIDELVTIGLHDLPHMQICKFSEQTVTLLSVIFQVADSSHQDLIAKFQQIRHQLQVTLDYMEWIIATKREFPSPNPDGGSCWW